MTRAGKRVGAAAVLGLAALCGFAPAEDEKQAKLVLEGGYTVVKGERDGEPLPKEKFKNFTVRFKGDKSIGTDKEKGELYVAKYKLDTSKEPWKIEMTTVEKKKTDGTREKADKDYPGHEYTSVGLIKKDGDMVVVIYPLPGGKEPTEFKTKRGDKTQMFWMKNENKGGKGKGKATSGGGEE